ncbi:hypothetical protein [Neobacillus cucumis]|uniref:hypothetical protein n=1 Tax=Neobacillus cucumis TaxID=1740721 RepID=UPI0028535262|nr:hypothetical protein [Neobacillus cucumis]MDR4946682.1 hypothetical protein [Neobacillus cucumis]
MKKNERNKDATIVANQQMSKEFKDFDARETSEVNSEAGKANQEIQEQFYGKTEEDNLLPFHVDINNPPIKK